MMRHTLLASALLASGLMAMPASAMAGNENQSTGEEKLAKMLAGRTAGKPQECINQQLIRSSRIINRTAIVYEMSNGTYYVNRPASGANFLRDNLILVTSTQSSQLCGVDIVRLVDNSSGMSMGSIGLGKFIPYPRAEKAK